MKKYLSCFLVVCTLMMSQWLWCSEASAEYFIEGSTNSLVDINSKEFPIPKLVKVEQISPNQIQISYDMDVDMDLGTKATNYWVQDTKNVKPQYIATLGKNDKVNKNNSLTNNLVKINSKDGSAKTFVLTFSQDIPKGGEYKLIICYVTVKGAPPYSGDNGSVTFIGK
ncbi:hypothetical protein GCM10008908_02110 [Clostridium subterminale]|uniref:Uncharacterized protein n=1 Tax=Clostridium subterminale TaxID=1550 RepID=A0ABN1KG74_CLOSU